MSLLTISWTTDATILLITIIILVYYYMTQIFQYWKKRGVLQIPTIPFFGNFAKCLTLKSPGYLLKNFYEQSENFPYVGIYIFDKPCLLLRDPEIIKQILIKDFNIFSDKFMHASEKDHLSNNCIFFIGNPDWKYIRSKLSSLYTSSKLKNMFESLQDVIKDLDDFMDSLVLEGSEKRISVSEICAKCTTDAIGLTAFGLKLNSLRDPNAEFQRIGKKMIRMLSWKRAIEITSICLIPTFTKLFDFRFFTEEGKQFLKKAFQQTVNERETLKIKRNDLIDLLIQLKDNDEYYNEESGFKLEGDNILCQAIEIFQAGYDTSSTAMAFTLYELAKNPGIQSKLRSEIIGFMKHNNGEMTYNMITDLQYLDMVVSETLRMYPPLPIIDRIAKKDYTIEKTGLVIEKGTPILIPILGLHYDPKYFANPNVFDPEHFSDFNKATRNPYVYMPFGIGPRSCIGTRQGLLQTKLCIAHIISKFEVTLSKDSSAEIDPKGYFTATKKEVFLNIKKIDANYHKP